MSRFKTHNLPIIEPETQILLASLLSPWRLKSCFFTCKHNQDWLRSQNWTPGSIKCVAFGCKTDGFMGRADKVDGKLLKSTVNTPQEVTYNISYNTEWVVCGLLQGLSLYVSLSGLCLIFLFQMGKTIKAKIHSCYYSHKAVSNISTTIGHILVKHQ